MTLTGNEQLRTKESDKPFHTARRMFWIINSEPIIAPAGTELSHIEFAEKQDWCNPQNATAFSEKHVRGFFLSTSNPPVLHFYKGEFQFDASVEEIAKTIIPKLAKTMLIPKDTQVFLGPKDKVIQEKEYDIKSLGAVSDFI